VHQRIDELGGVTNAFTYKQVTCYFTKSLASELDQAIELWNELLTFGEISQEEFDKESHVVQQEFRRGEDNPVQFLFRKLSTHLHEGTSLEMDVIGNEESLSTVTLDQMEQYRFEHYDLKNAALMILGNFDADKVYNSLNSTFGQRKVREEKPSYQLAEYKAPQENNVRLFRYDKPSPLALLGIGIRTPGARSEDHAALEILSSYISLGRSSLIQEKLVRSGITAFAFSTGNSFEDVGEIMILVGAPPPMVQQAHDQLMHMLHDALTMEITEELLDEVCDQIEYSKRRSREEPMSVLMDQAFDYWDSGEFVSLEESMARLRAVTVEDYNQVRQKVLGHLDGVYLMMGTVGDFHPEFPEGTWEGKIE
jgi:zinc protease